MNPGKQLSPYDTLPPLVIVEGFLGGAGAMLMGNMSELIHPERATPRRVLFSSVGPVSSLHDRACELFYSLIGGVVDYGGEHAKRHDHLQYGRTIEQALYPQWSLHRPLHFLGYSLGGPTIVKMQQLMKIGFFGSQFHPDMVLSLTAVSSPFRGTHIVYALGERTDAAPSVRPFSLGSVIAKTVHIFSYLSPLLPRFLDMHSEARVLSYRDASPTSLWRQLRKSDWAESYDATPYDMTFQATADREASLEGLPHPHTFYRSYCAALIPTTAPHTLGVWAWFCRFLSPFYLISVALANFDVTNFTPVLRMIDHPHSGVPIDVDYRVFRDNDGVVPLFSQFHPFNCNVNLCRHYSAKEITQRIRPLPGIWTVTTFMEASHISIFPLWMGSQRQCEFWEDLARWLESIEEECSDVAFTCNLTGTGADDICRGPYLTK